MCEMIRELQQRVAKQFPSGLGSCGVGLRPEDETSPEAGRIAAEDLQADLDEITVMISEGSPTR